MKISAGLCSLIPTHSVAIRRTVIEPASRPISTAPSSPQQPSFFRLAPRRPTGTPPFFDLKCKSKGRNKSWTFFPSRIDRVHPRRFHRPRYSLSSIIAFSTFFSRPHPFSAIYNPLLPITNETKSKRPRMTYFEWIRIGCRRLQNLCKKKVEVILIFKWSLRRNWTRQAWYLTVSSKQTLTIARVYGLRSSTAQKFFYENGQ